MMLDSSVDKAELSRIIKSLIAFIVLDGKEYVKDEAKEDYIKKYLFTLTQSMNGGNKFVNVSSIWKVVQKDADQVLNKEHSIND